MKSVFLFFLLATQCFAGDRVIVSDQVPPPVTYSAEVYSMTDAEFQVWANDFNRRQEAALEVRRLKMEPRYIFGMQTDYGDFGFGSQTTYRRRWLNPIYVGPGPMVIVNPYYRPRRVLR